MQFVLKEQNGYLDTISTVINEKISILKKSKI